jgi:hypothetical protein
MIFYAFALAVPENRDRFSAKSVLRSHLPPPSNCFIAAPLASLCCRGAPHLAKDQIITQRVYSSNAGFLNKGLI